MVENTSSRCHVRGVFNGPRESEQRGTPIRKTVALRPACGENITGVGRLKVRVAAAIYHQAAVSLFYAASQGTLHLLSNSSVLTRGWLYASVANQRTYTEYLEQTVLPLSPQYIA